MYTLEGVSSVLNFITAYEKYSIFLSEIGSLFPKVTL